MSEKHHNQRRQGLEQATVVDADVHIDVFNSVMRKAVGDRMDEPYGSFLADPNSSTHPDLAWPQTMGGKPATNRLAVTDPQADIQEALCDEFGIDYPVITPVDMLDSIKGRERALEEMRALNDVLVERFLDDNENFYGCCTVSARPETADKAAEEIDRMGDEDGIVGVFLFPTQQFQKPLGDPCYDVMYKAAQDNGLAFVYHGGESAPQWNATPGLQEFEKFLSAHTLGFPFSLMITLTSLIVQGTPVKFPDLNFVMLEAGLGWIPYMMGRLNREYGQRPDDAPLLEKSPEQHIRDSFYFGTQPVEEFDDPLQIDSIIELVGADSLLFASDHPHFDFDNPRSTMEILQRFDQEQREKILAKNAIEAYGLPM